MEVSSTALFSYLLDDLSLDSRRAEELFYKSSEVSDYWPGATVPDVVRLRMVRSFYKKLVDQTAANADDRCLEKFHASNLRCKEWQLNLNSSGAEELFGNLKRELDNFFFPGGEFLVQSLFDIASNGRCGPGASFGANGEDFYTKLFSSELWVTSPEIYKLYIEYISWFSNWRDAEINRLLTFGVPKCTSSSRLSFVRKTRDISRSICTEPALNMFFQLGTGQVITDRLNEYFGISLSDQPNRNRRLACVGSIDESVVTIDLESASDSLSLECAAQILPPYIFDILCQFRTPNTLIRGEKTTLHMVSTMGNGFTFPLQTAIFACVVHAAANSRLPRADADSAPWGVFGDDIICPKEISDRVCRLLDILGFRVNPQKSYFVGPFRESCGADFFKGVNVRGVYLKTLSTLQSRYVAINLLNEWSARTQIPLPRTVGYLVDSVRYLAIPAWENPDSGIRMPESMIRGTGLFQSKQQRYYYRCYQPVRTVLTIDDLANVTPHPDNRKSVRSRVSNLEGLVTSFLSGHIRNMQIDLPLKQGESVAYRTRTKVSPYWGPSPKQIGLAPDLCFWQRWNTAVETNLSWTLP